MAPAGCGGVNFSAPPPLSGVAGLTPTQLRGQLVRNGWQVLPIVAHNAAHTGRGKAPGCAGWTRWTTYEAPRVSLADVEVWHGREKKWPGTGVACGDIVAFDADFATDAQLADRIRNAILDVCGWTPFERQGAHPKFALIYRAAEPIPSVSLKTADGCGDGFDILAEDRQLVAYGVHRKTLNPYAWIGPESPLTVGPDAAPEVTQAQVEEAIRRVRQLVEMSSTGGRSKGRGGESATIVRNAEGRVLDGREYHLTRTVYATACAMHADGIEITIAELAERAWTTFVASTVLEDGRWSVEAARVKAAALLDRIRRKLVDLGSPGPTKDEPAAPTYPDRRRPIAEAERATREVIDAFLGTHVPAWKAEHAAWKEASKDASEHDLEAPAEPVPVSWGVSVATAVGKTREAIAGVAAAAEAGLSIVYAFPTHSLGAELGRRFAAEGIKARVYRGYASPDPDMPGEAMCLDLPAMQDAREAGVGSIASAVCERKIDGQKLTCRFYDRCGMQRQREAKAKVWLTPHALLQQARPEYIPAPDAVVIDENITMGALPDRPVRMTLDSIESADFTVPSVFGPFCDNSNDLEQTRANLLRALRDHRDNGPLRRDILIRNNITTTSAGSAYRLEWQRIRDPAIVPGMEPKVRRACVAAAGQHNRVLKQLAGLWHELRTFLSTDAEASGRLTLRYDEEAECRVLERRSLDTIRSSWRAPCLLLDATLPDPALIAPVLGHPVEVKADIAARWSPHGRVRQIVGAPTSATKLGIVEGREAETPRRSVTDMLRLIRLRAALVGMGQTVVVIGPMRLVDKLKDMGVPDNVECGHFGAIAGIDRWRDAAGLICIGQMQPGPRIVEALAGIVTGTVPETLPDPGEPGKGVWYPRQDGGIRLANGEGARVQRCQHPDPIAEALRWQITEGELVQAIGRLRALRRGPDNPFFLDIVNDVPLPLTVDAVVTWDSAKPGAWAGMAPEGVLLESAADIMACYPELAPTRKAAREVALPTLALTSILVVEF